MLEDDTTASETFELYGPTNYSMAEIAELVDKETYKHRRHFNIPKPILKPLAKYLNKLIWWKTTSADEIEREFIDQQIDPKAKTFKDLGIEPAELKNYTFHYLVRPHNLGMKSIPNGTFLCSKILEARRSTISPRQRSERRERKRSIYMLLTINDRHNCRPFLLPHVRDPTSSMYINAVDIRIEKENSLNPFVSVLVYLRSRVRGKDLMLEAERMG